MIVLGLILVIIAIAAAVLLFLGTQSLTTPIDLDAAGIQIGLTPLALLIAGAVIMLLLWFGLGMMRGSMKRKRRPGREAKEAQRQAELEESIRADERKRAEETHTAALADRDRAKDAELESKLAERDRARDDEFRTREREIEDRARADERERLEREFSARQATAAAAVPAAATGAASSRGDDRGHGYGDHGDQIHGGQIHGDHVDHDRRDEGLGGRDHTDAARGSDRTEQVPVAGGTHSDDRADGRNDGSEGERLYNPGDSRTEDGNDHRDGGASDADTADTADRPVHRTIADRLMGRDPQGHA